MLDIRKYGPVSMAELAARQTRIRMVGRYFRSGKAVENLYYLEPRHLTDGFFLINGVERAIDIEPLMTLTTIHSIVGSRVFDPTHAEYYSQIPPELLDQVVAIEYSDLNYETLDNHHLAQTVLYKHKS